MKNYTIVSGSFTTAGNFTGYTAMGKRVHVYARQMEGLGFKEDADVKLPLFVVAEEMDITQQDANGETLVDANGVAVVVGQRLTARSVFATKESLTSAMVDELTLDISIAKAVKAEATSAGLTEAQIDSLLKASI
jgi:hypothetical protein